MHPVSYFQQALPPDFEVVRPHDQTIIIRDRTVPRRLVVRYELGTQLTWFFIDVERQPGMLRRLSQTAELLEQRGYDIRDVTAYEHGEHSLLAGQERCKVWLESQLVTPEELLRAILDVHELLRGNRRCKSSGRRSGKIRSVFR